MTVMKHTFRVALVSTTFAALGLVSACAKNDSPTSAPSAPSTTSAGITNDTALFRLITQVEPFSTYSLFPNAEAVTSGTLNGSSAHQPMVRVSMNAKALSVLQNGKLPS